MSKETRKLQNHQNLPKPTRSGSGGNPEISLTSDGFWVQIHVSILIFDQKIEKFGKNCTKALKRSLNSPERVKKRERFKIIKTYQKFVYFFFFL